MHHQTFVPALRSRLVWIVAITATVLASLAIGAASARAGALVASADSCSDFETSQPFLPWLDPSEYILAPGGSFEDGAAGWGLASAELAAGNEPFYANQDNGATSLRLGRDSSATSPTVCVGLEHPTLRFFARNSGSQLATMRVDVRFEDATGSVLTAPIGLVTGVGGWKPTLPMVIGVNLLPLLPGDHTPVQFRFTPEGGDWQIDDVFVDPKRGG